MAALVDIILNVTTKKFRTPFTYRLPDALGHIGPGWRVLVPFGTRLEEGIIVGYPSETDSSIGLKDVVRALDDYPMFTQEMLHTAAWIADYYCCSMADALRFFMIHKKGIEIREWVHIRCWEEAKEICPALIQLADVRDTGILKTKFITYCTPEEWHRLLKRDVITIEKEGVRRSQGRMEFWVQLTGKELPEGFEKKRRQYALYQYLKQRGEMSVSALKTDGYSAELIRELCKSGLAQKIEKTVSFFEAKEYMPKWDLTAEQNAAVQEVCSRIQSKTYYPALLWGVTGSGKTEVYLRCTKHALAMKRQVLILVPEIALTGQIVRSFAAHFGDEVVIMHSKLSKGERYMAQLRFRNRESHICIGTRSAVFMPAIDLGLIIIDEEHDPSYRQEESPFYHARNVALKRAQEFSCPVLMGTATPTVESYYKASQGEYALLAMPYRIAKRPLPHVHIADMREELARGNRSVLSDLLYEKIEEALKNRHQIIILLNRRGFSTFVMCRKCGYTVKCDQCEVPMVYHRKAERLKCHYCEAEKAIPTVCPACGSFYIKYFGSGTEKAEEMIRKLFPAARVVRLDQDTASKKYEGERIMAAFAAHQYDILLGTQMVAKGHDIPNVTVVGILSADSSLNLPMYTASERTFGLLTQAAGRAGRGKYPGEVIIQTYVPEHETILASQKQDFLAFYTSEIAYRKGLGYPPFTSLLRIRGISPEESEVIHSLTQIYNLLKPVCEICHAEITPPFPEAISRIRGQYRYSLVIKGTALDSVKNIIKKEPSFYKTGIIVEIDSIV